MTNQGGKLIATAFVKAQKEFGQLSSQAPTHTLKANMQTSQPVWRQSLMLLITMALA